jgi:rhodanese-related sulfurtransferase/mono/diheme cytochrome c family protein
MAPDYRSAVSSWSRLGSRLFSATLVCLVPAAIALATLQPSGSETTQTGDSKEALIARGKSLYASLCARCHGADGDSTDYPGIVTLGGIGLRLPPGEIARLSAPFVGRTFEGEEAEALVAYLDTLGGAKGFAEPGHLFSAYLLEHKFQVRRGYRILDVRPPTAYGEGHIPHAVRWPIEDPVDPSLEEVRKAMRQSAVSEETFVVVYDEAGGPAAASVWWNLRSTGHRRAAVLDGGLRAWSDAGHRLSTQAVRIESAPEVDGAPEPNPVPPVVGEPIPVHLGGSAPEGGIAFDWRKTVSEEGLLPAEAIGEYLTRSGFRSPATYQIEGNREELGFLVWLLELTGREAAYDAGLLTVTEPTDRRLP